MLMINIFGGEIQAELTDWDSSGKVRRWPATPENLAVLDRMLALKHQPERLDRYNGGMIYYLRPQRHYKLANGVQYDQRTPEMVVSILEEARANHTRLKITLGDPGTGQPWGKEQEAIGYLSAHLDAVSPRLTVIYNVGNAAAYELFDHQIVKIEAANQRDGGLLYDITACEFHVGERVVFINRIKGTRETGFVKSITDSLIEFQFGFSGIYGNLDGCGRFGGDYWMIRPIPTHEFKMTAKHQEVLNLMKTDPLVFLDSKRNQILRDPKPNGGATCVEGYFNLPMQVYRDLIDSGLVRAHALPGGWYGYKLKAEGE